MDSEESTKVESTASGTEESSSEGDEAVNANHEGNEDEETSSGEVRNASEGNGGGRGGGRGDSDEEGSESPQSEDLNNATGEERSDEEDEGEANGNGNVYEKLRTLRKSNVREMEDLDDKIDNCGDGAELRQLKLTKRDIKKRQEKDEKALEKERINFELEQQQKTPKKPENQKTFRQGMQQLDEEQSDEMLKKRFSLIRKIFYILTYPYAKLTANGVSRTLGIDKHPYLLGIPFYFLMSLCPIAFIIIVLGVIPVGDPSKGVFHRSGLWTFVFIINPICMVVMTFLILAGFYSCAGMARPFRVFWPALVCVYIAEVVVMVAICTPEGVFNLLGLVAFLLAYLVVWIVTILYFAVRRRRVGARLLIRYGSIQVTLFIMFVMLIAYIIGYRYVPPGIQILLTIVLQMCIFIYRKSLLALTKSFPIDVAMLISGFWIPNLADMFTTLAYPSVHNYYVYGVLAVVESVSLMIQLIFLTRGWYIFQSKAKDCCKFQPCRGGGWTPEDKSVDLDDRGQSPNSKGFRIRQARFFFYRTLSKAVACIYYLAFGAVLRYGPNKEYYTFTSDPYAEANDDFKYLTDEIYIASVVFTSVVFIVIVCTGIIGAIWVKNVYYNTWARLRMEIRRWDRNYFGMVLAIITHNGMIAGLIVLYHWRIYWAWTHGLGVDN
eukprot:TRINITY_DN3485_c0_g1_i1.p1 TRINITY_DN3485_c0_g1~~TRINITY_DN3485_c0_g1_i1.p1  ORF type:complete len:664 (+),score=134.96 TRINITY_DN3485_c0_g1_i1:109-2100(+)